MGGYKFKAVYTPSVTIAEDDFCRAEPIRNFYLHQNYPNPFNAATEIKYYLPNPSHVKFIDI
jgi:hypothetical protein